MKYDTTFTEDITPYLIKKRRMLHAYPEVGFTEYVTTWRLMDALKDTAFTLTYGTDALETKDRYGVPEDHILAEAEQSAKNIGVPEAVLNKMAGGHTGFVAQLETGQPGPHVALRFDIDALPIHESNSQDHDPTKLGFASERPGVMHACGHDGHAAIGLGVAKFIDRYKDQLKGRYTLLFQPAEEGGRGAKAMVSKGWLDDVDLFLSGHIGIVDTDARTVVATTTKFLASTKLDVTFKGHSAHAGLEPNAGQNALLAAATAALHLHGIPRHKDGATRINVGTLMAGSGRNAVADTAHMSLETRGETSELDDYMYNEAIRIIQSSGDIHGVAARTQLMGKAITGRCDEEWQDIITLAVQDEPRITNVLKSAEIGASEDVTVMMERVQENGGTATFLLFPSPLPAGHHHPAFNFDEQALKTAVTTFTRVIAYINNNEGFNRIGD
ncbi:amidohydrolase [Lentibacillus saliphilus]|uniref:amidohydrolase n=1 Tax=Lentibacillus saliphilus TaxID=2737028 RepID=UPI001C2F1518|nr:amidohydrolase [Lentibacillus saliphilus]